MKEAPASSSSGPRREEEKDGEEGISRYMGTLLCCVVCGSFRVEGGERERRWGGGVDERSRAARRVSKPSFHFHFHIDSLSQPATEPIGRSVNDSRDEEGAPLTLK